MLLVLEIHFSQLFLNSYNLFSTTNLQPSTAIANQLPGVIMDLSAITKIMPPKIILSTYP